MGIGTFAVSSFVIGYDDLKKICPEQIESIENEKFFGDVGWSVMSQWLSWDDIAVVEDAILDSCYDEDHDDDYNQKVAEEVSQVYDKHISELKNVFNQKTGLTLYFDHYDMDGGNRYDEPNDKDGCIFCVDGMVQLTPAGEKYKDIVTERMWTQFG